MSSSSQQQQCSAAPATAPGEGGRGGRVCTLTGPPPPQVAPSTTMQPCAAAGSLGTQHRALPHREAPQGRQQGHRRAGAPLRISRACSSVNVTPLAAHCLSPGGAHSATTRNSRDDSHLAPRSRCVGRSASTQVLKYKPLQWRACFCSCYVWPALCLGVLEGTSYWQRSCHGRQRGFDIPVADCCAGVMLLESCWCGDTSCSRGGLWAWHQRQRVHMVPSGAAAPSQPGVRARGLPGPVGEATRTAMSCLLPCKGVAAGEPRAASAAAAGSLLLLLQVLSSNTRRKEELLAEYTRYHEESDGVVHGIQGQMHACWRHKLRRHEVEQLNAGPGAGAALHSTSQHVTA
jgi:hypothetical protein